MAVVVVHGWDKTPCVSSVATCPTPWLSQPYQSGVSLTGVWCHTIGTTLQFGADEFG